DEILNQVPLIKNPLYQPPKPVTLNTNFNKLIPTLNSVRPPKIKLTTEELTNWLASIEKMKSTSDSAEVTKYQDWINQQQRKFAPGFDFENVLVPTTKPQDKNELDELFGNVSI
ncbi:hypothetical protein HYPBUDRAFT_105019, partial [Hyphopichia burtonii NRRL Y-1933]